MIETRTGGASSEPIQPMDLHEGFISPERCIVNIVVLLFIILGFIFFMLNHYVNGVPLSKSRLTMLTTGMSQDEVKSNLGKPSRIILKPSGDLYIYESPFMMTWVEVTFDSSQRLIRYEIDD